MAEPHFPKPTHGTKLSMGADGTLERTGRPDHPVHRGRRHGPGHLARLRSACFDAAVDKAYGGKKKIAWCEVYAGQKAFDKFGTWLPDETVEAFRDYLVGIKGPLTTPIGGGIRSLNVALRQMLDLYAACGPCGSSGRAVAGEAPRAMSTW